MKKEDILLFYKQPMIPFKNIHQPTLQELFATYDYSVFPLSDINKINWIIEVQKMNNNTTCPCGSGNPVDSCHKVNASSIIMAVWKRNTIFDQAVNYWTLQNKIQSLCKKGCTRCCNCYFYVSAAEYYAMRFYLQCNNPLLLEELVERGKKDYARLLNEYPHEHRRLEKKDVSEEINNDHLHLDTFLSCPFIGKSGECINYVMRPLICRLYGTAYNYGYCKEIEDACRGLFLKKLSPRKVKQHMLGVDFTSDEFHRGIDYYRIQTGTSVVENGLLVQERSYPLIYWLSHDEQYGSMYNAAVRMSTNDYYRVLAGITK